MAKLHLFYNYSGSKTKFDGKLIVQIDEREDLYFEIDEDQEIIADITEGNHILKMYISSYGVARGYITQEINIYQNDVFYLYRTNFKNGRLEKLDNIEKYNKSKKQIRRKEMFWSIVAVIIIVGLLLNSFVFEIEKTRNIVALIIWYNIIASVVRYLIEKRKIKKVKKDEDSWTPWINVKATLHLKSIEQMENEFGKAIKIYNNPLPTETSIIDYEHRELEYEGNNFDSEDLFEKYEFMIFKDNLYKNDLVYFPAEEFIHIEEVKSLAVEEVEISYRYNPVINEYMLSLSSMSKSEASEEEFLSNIKFQKKRFIVSVILLIVVNAIFEYLI